ncbi:hypothetical protein [Actinomadura roseirufa]|uniref:hypothetical protein n=1 Tax=Actinomadura roseirufa TaxID=2094049 RepID=UPI001041B02A|nr:hypothetical protein [Actinomadura roseirufa]
MLAGSPAISEVQSFEQAGIRDKPYGHVITLRTGAKLAVQWVRTAPNGGEDQSQPETPVTGAPAVAVEVPDLPATGRIPLTRVEAHLAALILGAGNPEIRAVECISQRPDGKKSGINVSMHSTAVVYGIPLYTASAGQALSMEGAYQQRKDV